MDESEVHLDFKCLCSCMFRANGQYEANDECDEAEEERSSYQDNRSDEKRGGSGDSLV